MFIFNLEAATNLEVRYNKDYATLSNLTQKPKEQWSRKDYLLKQKLTTTREYLIVCPPLQAHHSQGALFVYGVLAVYSAWNLVLLPAFFLAACVYFKIPIKSPESMV